MAIWRDLATWVGPTTARTAGGMANPPRGVVLHIASGFYEGTISWQKRSTGKNRTSSHFIVGRDGRCAQMVDTADGSWAQRSGNNTWLSVELEGFAPEDGLHASHPGWETATPQQLEVCARLLAKAHQVSGVPLQLATSPSGRGLGHHSMGVESGVDWGHSLCPGVAIKGQKPAILARAIQIVNGDDDMFSDADRASLTDVRTTLGSFIQGLDKTVPQSDGKQYPIVITTQLQQLKAANASESATLATLLQLLQAATAGGASLDTAAVKAAIAAEHETTRQLLVDQHTAEMAALKADHDAEVAGLRAELAASGG